MKHLIRWSLLFLHVTASAQSPYRPFPESDAGWVETHSWLNSSGGMGDSWATAERTVVLGADSTINGTSYHRLLTRGQGTAMSIFPPLDTWNFEEPMRTLCYFRQDLAARQVIVYDTLAEQEVLWYDFTIGLGPYPTTWDQAFGGTGIEVVALDSMQLNDGWHRTWVLGVVQDGAVIDSAYCSIVEGVGATLGLHTTVGIIPPFEWSDQLDCHSRNGLPVFPFGSTECDLTMGLTPAQEHAIGAWVFPNPATDRITIVGADASMRYMVIDPLGRMVKEGQVGSGVVDLDALPPANYSLRLVRPDGRLSTARITRL